MTEPSCEPENSNGHWTLASLKEFFKLWLNQFEKYVELKFESTDKALVLADRATPTRLDNMNEWRKTYDDRDNTYFSVAAHIAYQEKTDALIQSNKEKAEAAIQALQLTGAELKGKADQRSVSVALAIAGIGIVVSLCSIALAITTLLLHLLNVI